MKINGFQVPPPKPEPIDLFAEAVRVINEYRASVGLPPRPTRNTPRSVDDR